MAFDVQIVIMETLVWICFPFLYQRGRENLTSWKVNNKVIIRENFDDKKT